MLDMNVTVVDDSQSFISLIKQNYSDTETRSQVELGYNILQCYNNTTTHMKYQKQHLPGKEYLWFQAEIRTEQESQCVKSTSLTKFIDNIISIESF